MKLLVLCIIDGSCSLQSSYTSASTTASTTAQLWGRPLYCTAFPIRRGEGVSIACPVAGRERREVDQCDFCFVF